MLFLSTFAIFLFIYFSIKCRNTIFVCKYDHFSSSLIYSIRLSYNGFLYTYVGFYDTLSSYAFYFYSDNNLIDNIIVLLNLSSIFLVLLSIYSSTNFFSLCYLTMLFYDVYTVLCLFLCHCIVFDVIITLLRDGSDIKH